MRWTARRQLKPIDDGTSTGHPDEPTTNYIKKGVPRRSLVAALPIMTCISLPLVQLGGIVYLYDIFIAIAVGYLGFPSNYLPRYKRILTPIRVLMVAVTIGVFSALIRTNLELRPVVYGLQYLAALIFFVSLYSNLLTGRVETAIIARYVTYATMALASFAIIQYFLMVFNRPAGEYLYSSYLRLAGFSERFFETRYLASVENTGAVRAMGTWDISTTFGGIMALSVAWLAMVRSSNRYKYVVLAMGTIASLASNSRHSWVVMLFVFLAVTSGGIAKRILIACLALGAIVIYVATSDGNQQDDVSVMSLSDQIASRYERTSDRGLNDSSLQIRYVEGTSRFVNYAVQDPSILLVGFGPGTDKTLFASLGDYSYSQLSAENYQFGFVSNGWLLIWRNFGILGLIGLIGLFHAIWRIGGSKVVLPLTVAGLIIAADNYAVQVVRCFFLILAYLAVVAANAAIKYSNTRQPRALF